MNAFPRSEIFKMYKMTPSLTVNTKHSPVPKKVRSFPTCFFLIIQSDDRKAPQTYKTKEDLKLR